MGETPGDIALAIAARLEGEREDRGLTQTEFAAGGEITQGTYSDYARGAVPRAWVVLRNFVLNHGIDANEILTGHPLKKGGNGR